MHVYSNVLDMIGQTPMVKINHLDTGPCELFLKLELMNPAGSIKDRIGLSMIETAEKEGILQPGGTIVEATAGNTGLGLALVAVQKGYKLIIVMPDKMSKEKIYSLEAMGAEVRLARSDVQKGDPEYYQEVAESIAKDIPGSVYIDQFSNPANVAAHYESTAPEIWEQMDHKMDAFICGVGSGGTLSGVGRYFKEVSPDTEIVLADPEGSILADLINEGKEVEPGSWKVEGIGEDFIPSICDLQYVSKAYTITDKLAFNTARDLLTAEGLCAGSSSGALLAAALKYCQAQTEPKRVVTLLCDTGNRYLSKIYNDDWMKDNELL